MFIKHFKLTMPDRIILGLFLKKTALMLPIAHWNSVQLEASQLNSLWLKKQERISWCPIKILKIIHTSPMSIRMMHLNCFDMSPVYKVRLQTK